MKVREITIDKIMESVQGAHKRDYITNIRDVYAEVDELGIRFGTHDIGSSTHATKTAIQQINQMVMPGLNQFAAQVIQRGLPELYTHAFGRIASTCDCACMMRTCARDGSDSIRAFLSPRYNRIDDDTVLGTLVDAMGASSEFTDKFKSIGGSITDTNTYLKFVTREPVFTVTADGRDRQFSAGIIFSNSETGHGTCKVQVLMVDRYCDNGCIFSSTDVGTFRLVHSGADSSAIGRFGYIDPPDTNNSKLKALRTHINGILEYACNADRFLAYESMLHESSRMLIDADDPEQMQKWVDVIGKYYDVTETERKAVVGRLIETGDRSMFGIQAALTDAAKYADSYDRKVQLESIGGKMLVDSPKRWDTIRKLVADCK
jgi:hypothetical protein